eukprot:CAMPEP_0118679306 /NCGR_PEP_ID=MMETSP0800-20121206/3715_1 /TAXON_ID=210618 ORGANISM="Striatella unipunctata, Strain CCMP2910" /NCGR_SAMPLE_ID=MMETSP0800 /ASSEMBLY_ACC=CAM_ASM_000638 /LENGTH=298 /DNA_ID=CAMNT_0006575287 /DNA_START=27 /DNA_END=923 /DNA_ORIENTATION=+
MENAILLSRTEIPKRMIDFIHASESPTNQWQQNSLEDFSLTCVMHLAEHDPNPDTMLELGALDVLNPIMKNVSAGIQRVKATMGCAFLGSPWSDFPKEGKYPTTVLMSELLEKLVKNPHTQPNDATCTLKSVNKAYKHLAKAAAKADEEEFPGKAAHYTKLFAKPPIVALHFSIISNVVAAAEDVDEEEEAPNLHNIPNAKTKIVADPAAAEHSLGALEAILPALLESGDMPRTSFYSEKASVELCDMLWRYTQVAGIPPSAQSLAQRISERIKEASGKGCPVLENSYELWAKAFYKR